MARYWRNGYRRKDGTWVPGHWVHGKNPKPGCSFLMLGSIALAAAVVKAGRQGR